jgi:translin
LGSTKNDIAYEEILKRLESLDSEREFIYKESRSILVSFPKVFTLLHEDKIDEAKQILEGLRRKLYDLRSKADARWVKYLIPAQIEYIEATVFLTVIVESRIPSQKELDSEIEAYLLGLLDCIGELRRAVYDKINEQNYSKAVFFFDSMKVIFESTSSFSYFDNVVPSLRRKIDLARRLIEETYIDMTKMKTLKI